MADLDALLVGIQGFDWDAGNANKNVLGHDVSQVKAEEIFFYTPVLLVDDAKHSVGEQRFIIYGSTKDARRLTAAFTLRDSRVRIISVRDMSRKERRVYENAR